MNIDLPPELEARLEDEAAKRGLPASEYASLLLDRLLTPTHAEAEEAARLRAIDAAMGAFVHVPFTVDDLHRERQKDKMREERQGSKIVKKHVP